MIQRVSKKYLLVLTACLLGSILAEAANRSPETITNGPRHSRLVYPGPDGKFGETRIDLVDEQDNPIGLDRNSEFAEDDFTTINQLHIPVNTKIRIDLSSKDVIHNFKLPELRVSQDAIPGMNIPVHFEATMTSKEFLETAIGTKREGKGLTVGEDGRSRIRRNLVRVTSGAVSLGILAQQHPCSNPLFLSLIHI